jgi:preprotein translocase subunit SecG
MPRGKNNIGVLIIALGLIAAVLSQRSDSMAGSGKSYDSGDSSNFPFNRWGLACLVIVLTLLFAFAFWVDRMG